MIFSRDFPLVFLVCGCGLFALSGCLKKAETASESEPEKRFPSRVDLEEDESGIARLKGDTVPFTGSVVQYDKNYRVTYFAHYQDGKKYGPEIRFHKNGRIYRVNDYHDGKQIHQREWHENGNQSLDAAMADGIARGRHLLWHENGATRFDGFFNDDFHWQGRVLDLKEDGTIIWDALFDDGRYVSGVYPAFMQPQLLQRGELKPEDAVYTEAEAASALADFEAEQARQKAEKEKSLE